MIVLIAGLVLVAGLFLVLGLVVSSTALFVVSALASAAAVLVAWSKTKRLQGRQKSDDYDNGPLPNWDKPLRSVATSGEDSLQVAALPEVAIDDYDELVAAEILPHLEKLSIPELEDVIRRESAGTGRTAVLNRAKTLIDLTKNSAVDLTSSVPSVTYSPEVQTDFADERAPSTAPASSAAKKPSTQRGATRQPAVRKTVGPKSTTDSERPQRQSKTPEKKTPKSKGPDLSL